jgi:hypothetical protein
MTSAQPPNEALSPGDASSSPILRAILKVDGETSTVEPDGKSLNRGDDSPNKEDAAEGAVDNTRVRRGHDVDVACTSL